MYILSQLCSPDPHGPGGPKMGIWRAPGDAGEPPPVTKRHEATWWSIYKRNPRVGRIHLGSDTSSDRHFGSISPSGLQIPSLTQVPNPIGSSAPICLIDDSTRLSCSPVRHSKSDRIEFQDVHRRCASTRSSVGLRSLLLYANNILDQWLRLQDLVLH